MRLFKSESLAPETAWTAALVTGAALVAATATYLYSHSSGAKPKNTVSAASSEDFEFMIQRMRKLTEERDFRQRESTLFFDRNDEFLP